MASDGSVVASARTYNVLALCGSLRVASVNAGLARYAQSIGSKHNLNVTIGDISSLPLFNSDLEKGELPKSILDLHALVKQADAVLWAVPEHNYGIPGPLKNAIDWLSRTPPGATIHHLAGKPAAIMGAGGHLGTGRAQYQLRQALVFLDMHPLNKPEVLIRLFDGTKRFDAVTGDLEDDATKAQVATLLAALHVWCERLLPAA
jgi:chromate reductase